MYVLYSIFLHLFIYFFYLLLLFKNNSFTNFFLQSFLFFQVHMCGMCPWIHVHNNDMYESLCMSAVAVISMSILDDNSDFRVYHKVAWISLFDYGRWFVFNVPTTRLAVQCNNIHRKNTIFFSYGWGGWSFFVLFFCTFFLEQTVCCQQFYKCLFYNGSLRNKLGRGFLCICVWEL